ncbi:GtrA family protein [Algibacter sp. L1A34]|uniref:GtrA family protein n=1 Tax=Algibacter sp. L1A34 TaxID=2686365 RepID=UPI00131D9C25
MKLNLNRETQIQILRYIYISICGYGFVFISLYLLVDLLSLNKSTAFVVVYGISYILLYTLQLKYLFNKKHDRKKFIRFCISTMFFYLIANVFYNIFLYFNIHYLICTALTIITLMPLRFIVSKFIVYK